MNRPKKDKEDWAVGIDRPEEIYGDPSLYYTSEEVEEYARSGGMRRTQQSIARRIIELLDLKKGSKVLDLGCGVGYTMGVYKEHGLDVIGLDVLSDMLNKAREKGLEVVEGDMRQVDELFGSKVFDAVVSASALQWLTFRKDLRKVASGVSSVLKDGGKAVIQFYPRSKHELMDTANAFKRWFTGGIVIDNPDNPMKRTIYLLLEKNTESRSF